MANLPLLLGHRGARVSPGVSENTLPSFDLALEHGCDGFEFDVRRTLSGTGVVCHDPKFGKISVARANDGQLSKLPRMNEVIQRYGRRAFLDIELKVEDLESKVLTALRDHPPECGHVVSSFLPDVVVNLEARSRTVCIGLICETRAQLSRWRDLPVDYVIAQQSLVDKKLVQEVQSARLKILVWTVNDQDAMLRLAHWEVDGIISDDTELLVRTLR